MLDLLKGIRVVDLSTVVLGPYATQMLADLGADVIKVEPKGGDVFRAARPGRDGGDGAGFLNLNRNKRSIVLDLTSGDDRSILHDLVRGADVLVHNMRPNSATRLGIDYEAIRNVREDIVYCSARGFGNGPYGDEPAYDDCIQAASGLAWLNCDANGEPRYLRTIACDKIAGLHLAVAIASGLVARGRSGKGVQIEVPMFEAITSFLMVEQLSGQSFVPSMPDRGYARLDAAGRKPYRTKDGFAAIMPYTARHWRRFLGLVGRDDLIEAPIVNDAEMRSANIDKLYDLIEQAAPERTTTEWLAALRERDIPCAPVNRLEDLVDDPHMVQTGFFATMDHRAEGKLRYARTPFASGTNPTSADHPAPQLDGDREAILAEADGLKTIHRD